MPGELPSPNRLRTERLRREWSQERLAELTDLHQPDISLYETGAAFPRHTTIEKLAVAFGVPDDVIFRWLREPAEESAA